MPESVYARAANLFHRDVPGYSAEDVSAIILGYDDGRIGVLHASNAAVPGRWAKRWQIVARRMTGVFEDWNSAELFRTDGEVTSRRIAGTRDVFVAQLEDVAARHPRAAPAAGAARGRAPPRCGSRWRRGARRPSGGRSRRDRGARSIPARWPSRSAASVWRSSRRWSTAAVPATGRAGGHARGRGVAHRLAARRAGERFELEVTAARRRDRARLPAPRLRRPSGGSPRSGLRFGSAGNVARYLRNGYMSWDGSYFVEPRAARAAAAADPAHPVRLRRDRARLAAGRRGRPRLPAARPLPEPAALRLRRRAAALDVETLIDGVPVRGERRGRAAGAASATPTSRPGCGAGRGTSPSASPLPPRLRGAAAHRLVLVVQPLCLARRAGDLLEHLAAARGVPRRDRHAVRHLPDRRRLHARRWATGWRPSRSSRAA